MYSTKQKAPRIGSIEQRNLVGLQFPFDCSLKI